MNFTPFFLFSDRSCPYKPVAVFRTEKFHSKRKLWYFENHDYWRNTCFLLLRHRLLRRLLTGTSVHPPEQTICTIWLKFSPVDHWMNTSRRFFHFFEIRPRSTSRSTFRSSEVGRLKTSTNWSILLPLSGNIPEFTKKDLTWSEYSLGDPLSES